MTQPPLFFCDLLKQVIATLCASLEPCAPPRPVQRWLLEVLCEEAPLEQGDGQGCLYITHRHKIWELVKGVEESGFHFAFRCGLVTLVE